MFVLVLAAIFVDQQILMDDDFFSFLCFLVCGSSYELIKFEPLCHEIGLNFWFEGVLEKASLASR